MAKLPRQTQKVFAQNGISAGDEIGVFGSLAASSPDYATDVEDVQSLPNWLDGWYGAVVGGNSPAIEDMNALDYVLSYQLAYLMQAGIAEWDAATTYYIGSFVSDSAGGIFYSLTNDNLGNALPAALDSNWSRVFPLQDSSVTTQMLAPAARVPVGVISAFGGTVAPTGYLLCDGAAVSRTTYANLFAAIGTAYGVGDGSTTFNIPNVQGLVLRGSGAQAISGRTKTGPAVGATQEDAMQGHRHSVTAAINATAGNNSSSVMAPGGSPTTQLNPVAQDPTQDGVNGTPRTGDETRVSALGVNYIIKF